MTQQAPQSGRHGHPVPVCPDTTPAVALVAVQDACADVMSTCAELARRGCIVLSAHAINGRARIVVAPPPERARLTASPRVRSRYQAVMATEVGGVQVEWRIRLTHRTQEVSHVFQAALDLHDRTQEVRRGR